jgi:hypothetical protein
METITPPSSSLLQRDIYNRNIGGGLEKSKTFVMGAGQCWAVAGLVVDDDTYDVIYNPDDPDDEAFLQGRLRALDQVIHAVPLVRGIQPVIEEAGRQGVLNISVSCMGDKAAGNDAFPFSYRWFKFQVLPEDARWVVFGLRLGQEVTSESVSVLENLLKVRGVSLAKHLLDGVIELRALKNVTITVACHVRIEPIPEPVE